MEHILELELQLFLLLPTFLLEQGHFLLCWQLKEHFQFSQPFPARLVKIRLVRELLVSL